MSAWELGKRKAVHEDIGVSRANRPIFRGQCHVSATPNEGGLGVQETPLPDAALAAVLLYDPRRLCAWCFPTRDRT